MRSRWPSAAVCSWGCLLRSVRPGRFPLRPETWLAVAYLRGGSAVMFALFVFVIQRWTASSASYMAALLPVTAVLAAASLLGTNP